MLYDYSRIKRGKKRNIFKNLYKVSKVKLLSYLTVLTLFLVVFFFLAGVGLFAWYGRNLPGPDKISKFNELSTVIYSRDGEPLYDIYANQNLVPVKLKEIPEDLVNATIAIEDKNFYKHSGFSLQGTLRGLLRTTFLGRTQGGSTLTQQLVKNVLLTRERSIARKVKELMLSLQIERKYSKDEILEMYLNNIPYGGTAWGVKIAAQTYFDKDLNELNLVESAILAGLPQAPTKYSPFGSDPTAYIGRAKNVLRRMREDSYITKEEEEKAIEKLDKVIFSQTSGEIKAPHFVMYVKEKLVDQFGENMVERGGLRVTTTLDLGLQEEAEKIVKEEVEKISYLKVSNGAAVVLDPKTGQILSMVGSKDYGAEEKDGFQGKFNVATQGLRQPGSAIKPITYAVAFKKGYTPASLLVDAPTEFPGGEDKPAYKPVNYDGKYRGPMQLRFALSNSINVVAVKVLALVGVEEMLKQAYSMGLSTLPPTKDNVRRFGLSITLGGGEVRLIDLTSAFGVFANSGKYKEPISILKVETSDKKTLFEYKKESGKEVLDKNVAFLISDILSDNEARQTVFGPRSFLNVSGKKVAVKTGTTNDLRDNWTIGYTKEVVVGVWVGNNNNSAMNSQLASGVTGAAPIWNKIIREALTELSDGFVEQPDNIVSSQVDSFGGGLPLEGQPTRIEYFIKGTEPESVAPVYQKIKLSRADNTKLANDLEIAKGEYEEKDFIVLEEDDPLAGGGVNKWQEGINQWLATVEDSKFHPPTETYNGGDAGQVVVNILDPEDKKQYDNNKIKVKAKATSLSGISKIEIYINDQLKDSKQTDKIEQEFDLGKGVYKIKVRAENSQGNNAEKEIKIGIQMPWDDSQSEPTVTPTAQPLSPTPLPTLTPAPTS